MGIKAAALVLGGGSGSRMSGNGMPKQYFMLGDKPVILHSVRKFLDCSLINAVIIVCPAQYLDYTKALAEKYLTAEDMTRVRVVKGGSDRNASLMEGLAAAEAWIGGSGAVVLTHDAARPFINERIIRENIAAAADAGACATVIPATDTIMESADGKVISAMPARRCMYQAQTPQSFRFSLLYDTMKSMTPEERSVFTDACGILQAKGIAVRMVGGDVNNIKITYPRDMYTAEGIWKGSQE